MALIDVDVVRRRSSSHLSLNRVDFILCSYNEYSFDEHIFQSVDELLNFWKNDIENNENEFKEKYHWIDVVNRSCLNLPENIKILCEHFDIHPLTIEDISTLTSYMKLDLFPQTGALYLIMKLLTWNNQRVEQQQISFYLNCSQNLLITFHEQKINNSEQFFLTIRNRLRKQQQQQQNSPEEYSHQYQHTRLRQLNVDYLFYSLLDDIIDRYMSVMEEIANCIGQFDEDLMRNQQTRTLKTLHSIYRLKHDLLHLRILFNPLKDIINRLQRTTFDDQYIPYPRTDPSVRLGMKHFIIRRQRKKISQLNPIKDSSIELTSIYLNEYIQIYLNDLNHHIDQLIDFLEIQRESVSILISFWITLNTNEIQEILNFLMMISVLFMPCNLLTAMHATNFITQPQYHYHFGYFILLALVVFILFTMIIWYKMKKWI